jgi:hypothetical protein
MTAGAFRKDIPGDRFPSKKLGGSIAEAGCNNIPVFVRRQGATRLVFDPGIEEPPLNDVRRTIGSH